MVETVVMVERISRLADELKLANLAPQIAACRSLTEAGGGVEVAVLGRFKAGKSSFLNHLTGCEVLPVGVVPLTAVITRLRHGPAERATVRFLGGEVQPVPIGEIGLFVGEKQNPDNVKQVAAVEVELPMLAALAPLGFVDTPGLGSAFVHNTEAAMKWLPNVGAAVVAVSADAPLSERDLGLLDELRRHTPRIVLLLTKADLLTAAQRSEVLAFVRERMARKGQDELPVFFYSVKPGFGELRTGLMEEFLAPLRQEHGAASEQILRHKLALVASQMGEYLRVALAAATQASSAREALRARLREEREQWGLLREELQALCRQWAASALESSLRWLQPPCGALQESVGVELRAQYAEWRLSLPGFVAAWREWLQGFLRRELTGLSHSAQAMFCEPVEKARAHLARTVRAFQDRLAAHVKEALGVTLSPRALALEVQQPSAPPVDVGRGFDVALDLAGYLVPMALFRGAVERVLTRQARWEVEKNVSRLAAAWGERVGAAIVSLTRQAERQAADDLAALEAMAGQTDSEQENLMRMVKELEAVSERLPG